MNSWGSRWKFYLPIIMFTIAAVMAGIFWWFAVSTEVRLAAIAIAIALISVGLGFQSLVFAVDTDDRIKEINQSIKRLEELQNEIKVDQEKQKNTNTPVVASMTALSQLVEFFGKKKADERQGDEKD